MNIMRARAPHFALYPNNIDNPPQTSRMIAPIKNNDVIGIP